MMVLVVVIMAVVITSFDDGRDGNFYCSDNDDGGDPSSGHLTSFHSIPRQSLEDRSKSRLVLLTIIIPDIIRTPSILGDFLIMFCVIISKPYCSSFFLPAFSCRE